MRRLTAAVTSAVLGAAGLVAASTAPAAGAPVAITIPGFVDMAVDEAHGNVLLTAGSASSNITVLSLAGAAKTPVPGLPGAQDIHLSLDKSVFYVTVPDQKAIAVIDAATLAVTKIPLGTSVCPTSVAQQDTTLWFTYSECGAGGLTNLGSVQLGTSTVTTGLAPAGVGPDRVEASPGLPGKLVARAGNGLVLLDVSGGPATAAVAGPSASTDARDFAITPDGLEVISTDYGPYRHLGISTADMTPRTIYPSDAYPDAVAVRSDGLVAAGISGWYSPDVYLYHEGNATLFRNYEFGGTMYDLMNRGLEFGATDLYAVTQGWDGSGTYKYAFLRITPKRATAMSISATAATYTYGAIATVKVHLSVPGKVVSVYATPYGGAKRLLTTRALDANGNLWVSTQVTTRTYFSASFAGDASYDAASTVMSVAVRAAASGAFTKIVGTSGSYKLVKAGSNPAYVGLILPSKAGQCVRFQLQEPYGSSWAYTQTTGCFTLNANSRAFVYFNSSWTAGSRARVRVLFGGDVRNASQISAWSYVAFVR